MKFNVWLATAAVWAIMAVSGQGYTYNLKENALANELARDMLPYAVMARCPQDSVLLKCGRDCFKSYAAPRARTQVIASIYDKELDLRGMVASNTHFGVVVAFRGSVSEINRSYSYDVNMMGYGDGMTRCANNSQSEYGAGSPLFKVHSGFLKQISELRKHYLPILKRRGVRRTIKKKGITLVGHSMGGALASLAAIDIAKEFKVPKSKIKLITFGQPRVGDAAYANFVTQRVGTIIRVTHGADEVDDLPPREYGYTHYPQELHIPFNGFVGTLCSKTDGEDPECSNDAKPGYGDPHMMFFMKSMHSQCDENFVPEASTYKDNSLVRTCL